MCLKHVKKKMSAVERRGEERKSQRFLLHYLLFSD